MPAPHPTPLIIAHRGDSSHRPENTLAAFAAGLETGGAIVDFDVHLTRDGEVVVIHDETIDRTTDGRGEVKQMTLAEIRRFSAGYPSRFGSAYAGERVPTLAETLGLLRERAHAMIEIKPEAVTDDAEGGIEAHVIEEVRRAGMEKDVALISFDRRALRRCQAFAPGMLRGHLFHKGAVGEMLEGGRLEVQGAARRAQSVHAAARDPVAAGGAVRVEGGRVSGGRRRVGEERQEEGDEGTARGGGRAVAPGRPDRVGAVLLVARGR